MISTERTIGPDYLRAASKASIRSAILCSPRRRSRSEGSVSYRRRSRNPRCGRSTRWSGSAAQVDGELRRGSRRDLAENGFQKPFTRDRQQAVVQGVVAENVGEKARPRHGNRSRRWPRRHACANCRSRNCARRRGSAPVAGSFSGNDAIRVPRRRNASRGKGCRRSPAFGGFQKARADDLVGIYVFHLDRHGPEVKSHEFGY